jgi:hypothetical protein
MLFYLFRPGVEHEEELPVHVAPAGEHGHAHEEQEHLHTHKQFKHVRLATTYVPVRYVFSVIHYKNKYHKVFEYPGSYALEEKYFFWFKYVPVRYRYLFSGRKKERISGNYLNFLKLLMERS